MSFDPDEAYCVEGCGRLAVAERTTGISMRIHEPADLFTEVVDLVCYDHAAQEGDE